MGACASKRTKQKPIHKTTTKKITKRTTTNNTTTEKKKEELSPKEALRASIIYLPSKSKDKAPFISSPSTSPSQPIYIGLDLGTVYSTVSIWKEGKPILVSLQGVPRVLSMVAGDDIHPKVYFGKDAMDLVGIKAQSIVFSLKLSIYRLDDRDDVLIDKFIEFMRARALPHDQNFNSVVTCLPGCFNDHGGVLKIRNMMSCQFNSKVRIISDTAATFLYYLDDRFGNILSGVPEIDERFVIINFGGGFFSCGETKIKNSRVQVIKEESFQVGGEMLVGHMMGIVSSKAGIMNLNAPGKLWNFCKKQAESIADSKEITLDLSEFGCENSIIKISMDEMQPSIERLLETLQGCVIRMVGNGDKTNILLSGGMCFFRPFREWLDQTFEKKVIELNNMTSACALGTAIYAGVLNSNGKDSLQLDDLPQFF